MLDDLIADAEAAYAAGLCKPMSGEYLRQENGQCYACPIGAAYMFRTGFGYSPILGCMDWAEDVYNKDGFTDLSQFVAGVDRQAHCHNTFAYLRGLDLRIKWIEKEKA